ncbi:hypothetical protein, partial [Mycolicibacterium austroafricanum]|uniref:hypothetical protein n=1 Tax=Mycolicibacterium austroafricanum TaxID=39687 RepID=UPI000D46979B
FFADGVVENETGALLAPYCTGLHDHAGQHNWEGESLAEAARRLRQRLTLPVVLTRVVVQTRAVRRQQRPGLVLHHPVGEE